MQSSNNINKKESCVNDLLSNSANDNGYTRKEQLTITSVLFIVVVMLIVYVTGIHLYRIYVHDQKIQSAIQMAKEQNRHIEIYTSDGY